MAKDNFKTNNNNNNNGSSSYLNRLDNGKGSMVAPTGASTDLLSGVQTSSKQKVNHDQFSSYVDGYTD